MKSQLTLAVSSALLLGSVSTAVLAEHGIVLSGGSAQVYFDDEGWTGDWSYLCVQDYCAQASLQSGQWVRDVTERSVALGEQYSIQLKVQDDALSQYISPALLVTVSDSSGGDNSGSGGDGSGGDGSDDTNQAPQVAFINLPSGVTEGDSVSLQVNASDDVAVASVSLYHSAPGAPEQLVASLSEAPYSWQLSNLAAGSHSFRARASDDQGLSSDAYSNLFVAAQGGEQQGALSTTVAERYRVRHELSFNDFNNFNVEYWVARFGYFTLDDYTAPDAEGYRQAACGTTEPCVVVTLNSAVPIAMTDVFGNEKDCNQQTPNWRYHKIYGDETNFYSGYVMDLVLSDGSVVPACQATREQRASATTWRAVMQRWQHIQRPFEYGEQIEFETTISFDRAQLTGDNVNYYGQTFRYVLGQGFVVNNRDAMVGPVGVNDSFAQLGGATTVPQLAQSGGEQQRLAFMQHAYNLSPEHIQSWLQGRRLVHTDFNTGNHVEELLPGPQAISGNLPYPEMAGLAVDPIQPSCTQCHNMNGSGLVQQRQDVTPPKIIGMGLLEAIPAATIETWAAENGGTVNYVTVDGQQHIGRFGWRAQTMSVRHQVAKALHDDMGIGTSFEGFGPAVLPDAQLDELEVYNKLIAVPTPRENLTQMPGHQLFAQLGCDGCHKTSVQTGVDPDFPELSNQLIHPYTDLLLHDLGEGYFRTAPLWGLGLTGYVRTGSASDLALMHDGEAATLDAVMQRHGGEAQQESDSYFGASAAERQQLLDYLMAL